MKCRSSKVIRPKLRSTGELVRLGFQPSGRARRSSKASRDTAHALSMEAAMSMKASEVGDWLRQIAGKVDPRKLVPDDDYLVLRPGPNSDWLMGNPVATQPPLPAPEQGP